MNCTRLDHIRSCIHTRKTQAVTTVWHVIDKSWDSSSKTEIFTCRELLNVLILDQYPRCSLVCLGLLIGTFTILPKLRVRKLNNRSEVSVSTVHAQALGSYMFLTDILKRLPLSWDICFYESNTNSMFRLNNQIVGYRCQLQVWTTVEIRWIGNETLEINSAEKVGLGWNKNHIKFVLRVK